MAGNPSAKKREKERARAQNAKDKAEKRQQRKQERDARPPAEAGVDPDLAGITWGPQPVVEDEG